MQQQSIKDALESTVCLQCLGPATRWEKELCRLVSKVTKTDLSLLTNLSVKIHTVFRGAKKCRNICVV